MSLSNTKVRILVSVIAIPFFLGACAAGGLAFLGLVLVIAILAYYELIHIAKKKTFYPDITMGYISVAAIVLNTYFHVLDFELLVLLLVFPVVVFEMFRNKGSAVSNIGTTLLGVFYIGLFLSCLIHIREFFTSPDYLFGGLLVITTLASIWVCDSAAYFGGLRFGKHRLFLRVSPKKSWEGAVFGFVFAVLTFIVARVWFLNFLSWTDVVSLGLIVGVVGQFGDLAESWLKRDAGVKDSSNIIPGHGGIMDRFDSLIAVAPVIYLYLKLFVKN